MPDACECTNDAIRHNSNCSKLAYLSDIVPQEVGNHRELGGFFFRTVQLILELLVFRRIGPSGPRSLNWKSVYLSIDRYRDEPLGRRAQYFISIGFQIRSEVRMIIFPHCAPQFPRGFGSRALHPVREIHLIDVARQNMLFYDFKTV